jgi:UDP-N-acetylglucosamine acyltransferase
VPDHVHPTAVVETGASLGDGVRVGAYAVIGPDVVIGAGTVIGPHVVVTGRTTIGRANRIYQFASLGEIPQDRKYDGSPTRTVIGDENVIREFVTINAGTAQDRGVTTVGDGNWLLAYSHVAHDCLVGNGTTFSNNAQLAGHVTIDDHAVLGGFVGVHQFCRVGAHAMVAAGSIVLQDVPPYVTAAGYPAKPHGINSEGLRRRGFSADDIACVKRAYKTLYRGKLALDEARAQITADAAAHPVLQPLVDFLGVAGRGIVR